MDSLGTIWITGSSAPGELPVSKGTPLLGPAYVAGLSNDGSTLLNIFTAPATAAGQAIVETSLGTTVALGSAASLVTVSSGPGPSLVGIANSAASFVSPAVAPEELISLYGISIGPSTPASGQVMDGVAPSSLSGVSVSFDGVAAGLLYVGPTQINAVVPSQIYGRDTTTIGVSTPSGTIAGPTMSVRPSQPQVFLSNVAGQNLSCRLERRRNVELGRQSCRTGVDRVGVGNWCWRIGNRHRTAISSRLGPMGSEVRAEERLFYSLEVLYGAQARGMVTGVIQVNFRLPPGNVFPIDGLQLQVGDS